MADPFTIASIGLTAFGSIQEARALKAAGRAAERQGQYQAETAAIAAGQSRAAAQREAIEQSRAARLARSRASAVVGAGGGQLSDVSPLISDIEKEGRYSAFTSLFEGEDRARSLINQGSLAQYEGRAERAASKVKARSSLMSGLTSIGTTLADKYGD